MIKDKVFWETTITIFKFKDPDNEIAFFLKKGGKIEDALEKWSSNFIGKEVIKGNVALAEGIHNVIDLMIGKDTGTAWGTGAYVGIGDSSAAEATTQTGLLGTNTVYLSLDSGYPTRDGEEAVWRATADGTTANFHWWEYTVATGAGNAYCNLNRKVEDKGTKASGETWTLELRVKVS
ncbi:MAG TPA: hypothetical protein ENG63_04950 [Candidatus Desulfofervidus auxilii]|uniref:Uncharacterized protein n=1 Tax=Desulfofervidus auxilii TaxID=1621989 RepID=A0A7C0Y9D0_DESA2|nr:hypothetical protein [Candidatus Desulfofervidus auxilii]